ncbi:IS1380 family transposase, partial [bacterium]|nr:IS1380 family transposase [bacterium]
MLRGIRKIRLSVEDSSLTHYGGMVLFQQFCRKLDLKRYLQNYIRWERRSSHYHPAQLILTIIYTMVAGMRRISDTRILHYNGYFQALLGLEDFPDSSTLRDFLKSLTVQEIESLGRLHDSLRRRIYKITGTTSTLIFDLDSTVLPLFGWKIEGAKVGYNPTKPGRPSYQPLICFEGHTRDTWQGILRPGDTHPVTGACALWAACRKKIPKYLYRIRADSGFFDHKFIEPLDEEGIGYVVVAKMTVPIQRKVQSLHYHTFRKGGWQAAQFTYQPWNWKRPHRFIVIRRPKPKIKEEENQLTLWEFKEYFYHTFVTNLTLNPESAWHFYKPRARCELDIRELKESFPLGSIPTNNFLANQIHFHLILLAYDLVNWFKRLCLPVKWQVSTLQTIRTELLV